MCTMIAGTAPTAFAVLAILALCGASLAAKLPANYHTCHVNDVDFHSCLTEAVQYAINKLAEGEKSLGIPSIAPLKVDAMTLDLGQGPISLLLDVKDLDLKGLENTTINSAELDPKTGILVVKALTKHMRLDFQYKASGKILVVAVRGDGPAFFEFDDVKTTHTVITAPEERKGKTYWTVTDYKVVIDPAAMRCHFHELLKGNKAISEQVNNVLNEEWQQFYQQIRKPAQEAFGDIFKQLSKRVFDRVPINEIYLDI